MSDSLKLLEKLIPVVKSQEKFCTKPELEMLLIIAENKIAEFEKVKSKQKPKDFYKQNIVYNHRRYDNSTQFYEDYFQDRIELLTFAITKYHRIQRKHQSDERYLFDLLK